MYFRRLTPGFRLSFIRVLLAATTYISGCGKDDRTAQADQSLEDQLIGVWKADCLELSPDRFELLRVEFKTSGKFFVFQTLFADKKCEKVSVGSLGLIGSYVAKETAGASLNETSGSTDGSITWKFSTMEMTATQDSFTSDLKEQIYCGVSDWVTNEAVGLAGKECQYFDGAEVKYPVLQEPSSETVEIVGNKLYLKQWFRFEAKLPSSKRFLKKD